MADDRIPQAQGDVLDASGKRFTLPWYRFLAALDGILTTISDGAALALLKANNLSDVASAATAFANIKQAASGTTTGVVQQTQVEAWAHMQVKCADGTYFLCTAPYAGTITSTTTDCLGGTCTVRWYIDGVAVGTANNSVSTTQQVQTHTSANTFGAGAQIAYIISSNSSCVVALLQANISRNLAA